ncbi:uncharacterized protein G2W53_037958 [Senna tora]|uniref:Uncharacterized protein n=1 Tax=Senna tora TaxID=362788 RepID=A0A834SLA4_9FABA|nr:uncharacterized protein G2W53_037958 [Senna tora]
MEFQLKISAQDHEEYNNIEQPSDAVADEQVKTSSSSFKLEPESMQKKKMVVRFNLQSDDDINGGGKRSCSTSEGVRIRLMVTREELQRIVRYENDTCSLEQLLCAIKLGRSRISELPEDNDGSINTWRPTLETIPEDR